VNPGRPRPRIALACVVTVVLSSVLAGCGLPDEERTQVVENASVPYDLLGEGEATPSAPSEDPAVPREVPVVFWLGPDERLAPSAVDVSCEGPPADVVREVLDALAGAPSTTQRDSGLASAIPSTARLGLVRVEEGVAEVDLDPVAIGDAERLPLAVGQVVLSVTSAPGVDAVELVTSGRAVDVPLPGGALATGAVTADDYAVLLPSRLRSAVAEPGDIGCPVPPS
jgi:hypothetical protein